MPFEDPHSDQFNTELDAALMKIDALEEKVTALEDEVEERDDEIKELEDELDLKPSNRDLEELGKAIKARDFELAELWLHRIGVEGF